MKDLRIDRIALGVSPAAARVLAACVLAACADEPARSAADIADAFLGRANRGDVESALSLVHADVVVRLPGEPPLAGIDAARRWLRWDSVLAVSRRPDSAGAATEQRDGRARRGAGRSSGGIGDTVRLGALLESSLELALLGRAEMERLPGSIVVVHRGRVREIMLAGLVPTDRSARDSALADFLPWVRHEYPERLARVRRAGGFDYGRRPAAEWLALLREWRAGVR